MARLSMPGSKRRGRSLQRSPQSILRANLIWGVATVAILAIAVYVMFNLPLPWSKPRTFSFVTSNAGALRVSNAAQARIAGVNVGVIKGLEPADGMPGFTKVTVKLEKDTPVIHEDATVKIRPKLFIEGNFFFDINPGTPNSPKLSGSLPPQASTIAVAADDIFTTFDSSTRANLKTTLRGFGGTLGGGGDQAFNALLRSFPPALANLSVAARTLQGQNTGDLAKTVREAGDLLEVLDRNNAGLQGTITNGRRAFDAFAQSQDGLRGTFRGLDATTAAALPALAKINNAIPQARALVRDARPLIRNLPNTLDQANPAFHSLERLGRSGDVQGLVADLRPTLRTASRSTGPLAAALRDLRPITQCTTKQIIPTLNAKLQDGALTTNLPAWQEFASAFEGFASSAADGDANGKWLRVGLNFGRQVLSFGGGPNQTQTLLPVGADQGGSNPAPPGHAPPLRPDVPCESQPAPDFSSTAVAPRGTTRTLNDKQAGKLDGAVKTGLSALQSAGEASKTSPGAGTAQLEADLRALLGGDDEAEKKATAAKSSSVSDSAAKTADTLTTLGGAGR